MICHECSRGGVERAAVAVCKFCTVGLCKPHLVESYKQPPAAPQYSCRHQPAS